ncbi:tetratricopeptide repeat protein [Halomonas sp. CS7]|uniref:Tetratricopeptide repeat protein n=1 Tax=Halomonas pelophila TaxID=3151122 RepID=A0ABV1N137_9GAMM
MDANASPVTTPGFPLTRRPMRRLAIAALLTLLFVGSVQAASPRLASEAEGYAPEGSCAGCHQEQTAAWQDSDHGWAMREATPDNVLGDFADARFAEGDVKAHFHREDERFLVTLEGPGEPEATREIAYTFGYFPLQQYLIEMPGGRLQSLTIAWDSREAEDGGQRWFSLYPGQAFTPDDPLHWQGRYQNWNAMCADCHSTNLQKHYDPTTDSFATTWHEQSVGCQSCHGPSRQHLEWAETWSPRSDDPSPPRDEMSATDKGLGVDLDAISGQQLVGQCARCHSRRQPLGMGPAHGQPLLDSALPSLLTERLYHADGQIQGEVYVYGSFAQSRMYQEGVTCTNCHDPHTNRLRLEGNAVCTQCHNAAPPSRFPGITPTDYDSVEHHHHPPGSEGAQCVSCHMPETTYMVVDPRRDHSFRVPRPDLNEATGSPDACTSCHDDMAPERAATSIATWFGDLARAEGGATHYGEIFAAARQGRDDALPHLQRLAADEGTPAIVRATAVDALADFGVPALPTLEAALVDEAGLVRAAGVPAFARAPDAARVALLLPLLDDPLLAVRDEVVKALAGVSLMRLPEARRDDLLRARRDYERRLRENADLPGNRLNLAVLLSRSGRADEAITHYRAALAMDPYFLPARSNLITLLSQRGKAQEAQRVLEDGLALEDMPPTDRAHLAYLLALSLAEAQRFDEALSWLDRAAEWRPEHVRTHYNRALLLDRLGRKPQALAALERGLSLAPEAPDLLYAAVYLNAAAGNIPQALSHLERLRRLQPDDPRLQRLERQLQRQ